ncbi:MAG TPA: recombinase family protein [Gemmatales bacterium]|nr:recombinase family protein [Gemmatales bacterium]
MNTNHLFDPKKEYKYIRYLRMSTNKQNDRSPDQQAHEIELVRKRNKYPWIHLRDYRDDGISGKLLRKRPSFKQMLLDIKARRIEPDLILLDTFERFGRAEELESIRRELARRYGVLLLTGDTGFSDPTTFTGKILATVESCRAIEDNRIKGHNIRRGRRDAVLLGHWPGGPVPTGFTLEHFFIEKKGIQTLDHAILIPHLGRMWIIRMVFKLALDNGWGSTRIARHLNEHADLPDDLKPVSTATVCRWLSNWLYVGEYRFGQLHVEIVDDVRKQHRNPEDTLTINPDFCTPIVERDVFLEVQRQRQPRSERAKLARAAREHTSSKLLQIARPGGSVLYPLSGLVICDACGRSMVPRSAGVYTTKSGERKRYTAYICPGRYDNICPNSFSVKEEWLRAQVFGHLRQCLFPGIQDDGLLKIADVHDLAWYAQLRDEVRLAFERLSAEHQDQLPVLESRIKELREAQQGRMVSLTNPKLNQQLRCELERNYEETDGQIRELNSQAELARLEQERSKALVDDEMIIDRLNRLASVFGLQNPTRASMELALHIDHIRCDKNGKIVLRVCKLGALTEVRHSLQDHARMTEDLSSPAADGKIRARRRTVRQVDADEEEDENDLYDVCFEAADPNRFRYLGPDWFSEVVFQVPEPSFWARDNAMIVMARKTSTGWSNARLAREFDKCPETIRKALRIAQKQISPPTTEAA